ncbi:hypothetical protein A4D02_28510 [Niastella koreensis]|uniref:KAP P-loop domain protein n=2 Tax=Niastella koreensis TaxID=354356 RepID=G8T8I5_NIAKG|nr:P-loop NTPase fold protein [Niastella koreensis]AEW00157.1 KAP P-loop domain protein [Niastella koreensis GR20-10]OQP49538.1 hypothetical protein A4D02_28510 [Niastella koreensis]
MELFRPDSPISSKAADRFQRYNFAHRIAQVVSSGKYSTSLVVGIYGKWGEGKTSVMNCIQQEIGDKAVVINFNPWLYNEEKQLIKSFFSSIATALGQKLVNKQERALEFLGDYADSIGSLVNLAVPGLGILFGAGKKVSEKLRKDSVEALKKKVDDLIIEANSNFVIFIDDIDRLDIQEVQAVFKLVKLVGDFPRTAYVLSFDDDMVAAALAPKYAGELKISGYNFLEKIIQMPLHLPKASNQALRKYAIDLLNDTLSYLKIDLTDKEGNEFISKFDKGFLPALTNPRLAVRYANTVGFSIPLLLGEVNIIDLMIIEGFKTFYPTLYHFIRNNPDFFIRNFSNIGNNYSSITIKEKDSIKVTIDQQLEIYQPYKERLLNLLLDLFPQLQSLYRNYHYQTDLYQKWHRERRVCSPQHFDRYFSYVVQNGDISDIHFKNLLADLDKNDLDKLRARFESELPTLNPDNFIFKLKNFTSTFNEEQSAILAVLLALFGENFPKTRSVLSFSGRDELEYIIRELLEKLPKKQRGQISSLVLKHAQPLEFAVELYRNLSNPQHRIEDGPFLDSEEVEQLSITVIKRIREQLQQKDLFEILPDYALWIVFNMHYENGGGQEINIWLLKKLNDSSSNSLKIIKIFTPTIYSTRVSYPYKGNFTIESYEQIGRLIDLKILYEATVAAFGHKQYTPLGDMRESELTDDNLLGLFQKMWQEEESRKAENRDL